VSENADALRTLDGTRVGAIGQGAGGILKIAPQAKAAILREGVDLGMNLIDTAPAYGEGISEEIVRQAIRGVREQVFVATKFETKFATREGVSNSLRSSLKRLGTDYVDLLQFHWPNPAIPVEESLAGLADVVNDGLVRHIGFGNFAVQGLRKALELSGIRPVAVQTEYNLLDRTAERDVLPWCEQENLTFLAYSPLAGIGPHLTALDALSVKYGITPIQLVLNWLAIRRNVLPLPMTSDPEHLRANAMSLVVKLDDQDFNQLESMTSLETQLVPTSNIKIQNYLGEKIYSSLDEAIENRFSLEPSIAEISEEIKLYGLLKPVRLSRSESTEKRYVYSLERGRMRYWAWVLTYGDDRAIPAVVQREE